MLRFILHKILGYKVVITCEKGITKNDEPLITRCWLSKSCTVHAYWNGQLLILNTDKSVSGLPADWKAKWTTFEESSL